MTTTITERREHSLAVELHRKTPEERLDLFRLWANERRDPLTIPTPTSWPEFDAKWSSEYAAEHVVASRLHRDRYYSDHGYVALVTTGKLNTAVR